MKKLLLALSVLIPQSIFAVELEQAALDRIFESNYEVVIAKPTRETVTYEKKLPLHLLPFQYRNDKYYSVGSAFRIKGDKFVSAAHVFSLGQDSQNKNINLRDDKGKIYPIDKIYKYSKSKDFVVFTVKGVKPGKGLKINTQYSRNKKVNAVGNALGEGVVIRDGLYTSDTPESISGEWNWIRFSAAASPGNSGGPLIDDKGNVIGIILRKSKSENLNYALPMKEAINFEQVADMSSKTMVYRIDYSDDTSTFSYKRRYNLPMDIAKLDKLMQKDLHKIYVKSSKDFLKEHDKNLFPKGEGSKPILYNRFTASSPRIIQKGTDGIWDMYKPKELKTADTGNNGRISFGKMGNFYYLKIKRPDNVKKDRYYSDSKLLMDQILNGINFNRYVSSQAVKVTSAGKSSESYTETDNYGRKWQVGKWLFGFSDQKFVLYALPTPDGYVGMLSITNTGYADMMEIDMKIIINNLYYSYYGTLEDWEYFIKNKELAPDYIKHVSLDTDKKSYIKYKDKNFNLSVDKKTMKITKESDLELRFSYFQKNGKVVWEPAMIVVSESKNSYDYASFSLNRKPPKSLNERYISRWDNIINRRTPYNEKSYMNNDTTNITKLKADNLDKLSDNEIVYAISWHESGTISNDIMESKVKSLKSNFRND
ncbi:MAG: serine protease [Gammaproteobacteria bacterium]|nr:serine protease [Gammaproteobacteria bacterium]